MTTIPYPLRKSLTKYIIHVYMYTVLSVGGPSNCQKYKNVNTPLRYGTPVVTCEMPNTNTNAKSIANANTNKPLKIVVSSLRHVTKRFIISSIHIGNWYSHLALTFAFCISMCIWHIAWQEEDTEHHLTVLLFLFRVAFDIIIRISIWHPALAFRMSLPAFHTSLIFTGQFYPVWYLWFNQFDWGMNAPDNNHPIPPPNRAPFHTPTHDTLPYPDTAQWAFDTATCPPK